MTTPTGVRLTLPAEFRRAFQTIASAYVGAAHSIGVALLKPAALREHRRRCRRCPDLPGYPRPLRVNGADYHRRRKARARRGR